MVSRFLRNSIYSLCFFILLLMIFSTLFFLSIDTSVSIFIKVIYTIFLLLGIGLLSYVSIYAGTKKPKLFLVLISFISLSSCILWNIYSKTIPVSDYKVLLDGALKIAQGTFNESFDKTSYFYMYNYQVGYAAYLAFLIKVFGQNLFWFKLMDVIYITASALLIYIITRKFTTRKIASIASILYSTFIFNILGSSIINNQHLSGFLMLAGLYLFILGTKSSILASGIVFAVMNVFRPVGIIIVTGVFIQFFYNVTKDMKFRKNFLQLVIFIFSFYSAIYVLDAAFIKIGLAPSPISSSHVPYYKFVIGLGAKNGSISGNQTVDARNTNVYYDLKDVDFDYEKYNNECIKFLKQRIKNYKNTATYLFEKMRFFMGEKDHQYTFALNKEQLTESIVKNLTSLAHIQYLLLLVFALLTLALKIKQRKIEINIIYILFIGFILVHLFVEAQTRYRYEAYIFIIILAANSIGYICDRGRFLDTN